MRKGTFSPRNAKKKSTEHNMRVDNYIPRYLIRESTENIYRTFLGYECDAQYLDMSKTKYTEKHSQNQKMQSKQEIAFYKEAVLSLEEHHTEEDVLKVFEALQKKMGGHHLLELAIHKDEGHFERIEEGWDNLSYYPNEEILKKEDGNWYIMSDETKSPKNPDNFDVKADMSKFKMVLNIHAHAKYTMFNMERGKSDKLKHYQTKQRLKIVCDSLGMKYEPREKKMQGMSSADTKRKHKERRMEQYRNIQLAIERGISYEQQIAEAQALADEKLIAKDVEIDGLRKKLEDKGKVAVADLNRMKAEYRQKMIDACEVYPPEAYQALNKVYEEAIALNKTKDLDIDKLQEQTAKLINSLGEKNPKIEKLENEVQEEKSKKKSARKERDEAEAEVKELKSKLESDTVNPLTEKNYHWEELSEQYWKLYTEEQAKVSQQSKSIEEQDVQILSYEAEISDKAQEIEDLKDKVNSAAQTISSQKKDIYSDKYYHRDSQLKRPFSKNKDVVLKLEKEIEELIEDAYFEKTGWNDLMEREEILLFLYKDAYVDLKKEVVDKEGEIIELKEENSKLKGIIDSLKTLVSDAERTIQSLLKGGADSILTRLVNSMNGKQKSELEIIEERLKELEKNPLRGIDEQNEFDELIVERQLLKNGESRAKKPKKASNGSIKPSNLM